MVDKKRFNTEIKSQWCPGCGNFGILESMKDALAARDIPPEKILIISGIGQAAKTPHFMTCNMFHSLHGRALPLATGAKLANQDLNILVNSGDGDCYGEGGNHFMHCIRRNLDMTLLVHNNQIYGLTKGQASPTSAYGMVTTMQTGGVISDPFNGPMVALALGAGFVARGFSGNPDHLSHLIQEAMAYKGFSLIDIMQPCVSFNKVNTNDWYKKRVYELEEPVPDTLDNAIPLALEWGDKIPIGILYRRETTDFTSRIPFLEQGSLVSRSYETSAVQDILDAV